MTIIKPFIIIQICVIIFFATNDGLRDTFLEGSLLSYLKEVVVILLFFILTIIAGLSSRSSLTKGIIFFNFALLFLLITSFVTTTMVDPSGSLILPSTSFGGWGAWIKVLVFALLTNSLILLYSFDRLTFEAIPRFYIYGAAFYSIITIFFVLTGINNALPMRNWYGRISIGYPTMDSFMLVVACAFATYHVKNIVYIVSLVSLFTIVLIMQNTVTGYILYFVYLCYLFFKLQGKMKLIPLLLVAIGLIGMSYIYIYLASEMGAFGTIIQDKINGFLFGNETASITIRQDQINHMLTVLKSEVIFLVFGIGGIAVFSVENQVYSILGMFGLIGLFIYIFLFLYMFFVAKRRKDTINCLLVTLYLIGSTSLPGLYLFPLLFIASYTISRFYLGYTK